MKSQLPALVRPISSTSHAVQPLVSRQPKTGVTSHNADHANDTAKAPQGPYGDGDSRLDPSANVDRRVYHGAILVRTKKKRFG